MSLLWAAMAVGVGVALLRLAKPGAGRWRGYGMGQRAVDRRELCDAAAADSRTRPRLCVVALGDLGRSPRSTYHAWAAAESGFAVDLVGETATPILKSIALHPHIRVHALSTPKRIAWAAEPRAVALARSLGRVIGQCFELRRTLQALPRLERILVQSPPAIPTLAIAWLAARRRQATFLIDWHNFGFSLLARRVGSQHPVVALARRYEWSLGRRADGHLCVSQAMARVLRAELAMPNVTFLYDRAPEHFRPLAAEHKPQVRQMLATQYGWPELATPGAALAISPTSFTPDEDMTMLFDALARYGRFVHEEEQRSGESKFPLLLVALSGKGDLRAACEQRARDLQAYKVTVGFLWVDAQHYPDLLAAADLGICLHQSTSGVDLPMKVADLLGAGIPVCAFDYGPCLREQIADGATGVLFRDENDLAQALRALFEGFHQAGQLSSMTDNVLGQPRVDFADEWRRVVMPLLAVTRRDRD